MRVCFAFFTRVSRFEERTTEWLFFHRKRHYIRDALKRHLGGYRLPRDPDRISLTHHVISNPSDQLRITQTSRDRNKPILHRALQTHSHYRRTGEVMREAQAARLMPEAHPCDGLQNLLTCTSEHNALYTSQLGRTNAEPEISLSVF